jgi:hypothetical protein
MAKDLYEQHLFDKNMENDVIVTSFRCILDLQRKTWTTEQDKQLQPSLEFVQESLQLCCEKSHLVTSEFQYHVHSCSQWWRHLNISVPISSTEPSATGTQVLAVTDDNLSVFKTLLLQETRKYRPLRNEAVAAAPASSDDPAKAASSADIGAQV